MLEDDFDVKSRLTYDLVSKLPKDYDLFYLGRNPIYNWQGHEFQDIPTETAPFLIPAPSFNSHAYLLSFKGVSKLLSLNFNKNIFAVDDFLIASSVGHVRPDLNFIDNKISALALESDLVSQNRPSEESGALELKYHRLKVHTFILICIHITMIPMGGRKSLLLIPQEHKNGN